MDRRELFDDPEEAQRMAFEGQAAGLWTALPGIVEAVNLAAQTVSVQLAIRGMVTNEAGASSPQNMPLLVDVPICWPRAGGFAVTLPVAQGDEVLVVFSARCIDAWWQSGGVQSPLEERMHDLSDGFAIFAPSSQPRKLNDVQSDGVELRNEARSVYMKVANDGIHIKGKIFHEGDVEHTGSLVHTGGTMVSLTRRIDGGHTHVSAAPGVNTSVPNA